MQAELAGDGGCSADWDVRENAFDRRHLTLAFSEGSALLTEKKSGLPIDMAARRPTYGWSTLLNSFVAAPKGVRRISSQSRFTSRRAPCAPQAI